MRALFFGTLIAMTATAFAEEAGYRVQLDTIHRGYDGKTCWVHARAGAIPTSPPSVVLTMQKLLLTGSDVFYALNDMRTDDMGKTWSGPTEHADTLGRRDEADGVVVAACDFWPKWHAATGKMLGIGHTVRYRDNRVMHVTPRQTTYAIYDPERRDWTPWTTLAMPDEPRFANAGAGCVQRVDLPNGDILLPIYFKRPEEQIASVTVLRCRFDGKKLEYVEHGDEMTVPVPRGFAEPSLTVFNGRYYLTLRNDERGYVTSSSDGLHFDEPQPWLWDDGSDLGNYNTQQHWVTHSDAMFLVYTRRGADNDHVFRNRAPLFMARVDPQALRVMRATERILLPQRGARFGNFGVVDVGPNETWVTDTEWMQQKGPNIVIPVDNPYGADNSVYAARIVWEKPNTTWDQR
jgi:hypothetical protein